MVSLERNRGQSGFASASDRDSVRSEEVDLLVESNNVSSLVVNRVLTLSTPLCLVLAILESIILIAFEVMIFVLAQGLHVVELGGGPFSPLSLLALLHVLVWFMVVVFYCILTYQHAKLRLRGYLDFSRKTRIPRRIPPLILSCGNALILAYFTIMNHEWASSSIERYVIVQIISTVEFVIVLPSLFYYILIVYAFNKKCALPDAHVVGEDNVILEAQGQIGYSDIGWPNSILEKQADMICYLQQHNENLSRRLLRLSPQANDP